MLILKYFLTVGLVLTAGLFALSAYLESGHAARATHSAATATTASLAIAKPNVAPKVDTTLDDMPVAAPKAEKPARASAPRRATQPQRETGGWDHQNQGYQNRGQAWGQSQGWGNWGHRQF